MTAGKKINCHFVTRALTQPWELKKRRLKYFDFAQNILGEDDSKTLFSQENLNSGEIEGLLNKLVEEPISKFKTDLQRVDNPTSVANWKTYRALFLYFLVQAPRFAKTSMGSAAREVAEIDKLLAKDESYLDQLIHAREEDHHLRVFKLPEGNVMLFPEIGYFAFPVEDAGCVTGFTYGYAVPLFPNIALALTPKTATETGLKQVRESLHFFSAGLTDNCAKVVVPREAVEQLSEEEIIEMLQKFRTTARTVVEATNRIRELVVQMYEIAGLKVGPKQRGTQ